MLRLSFRELEGVRLWYCEGVYCVLLGDLGVCPPEEICFFKVRTFSGHF